MMWLGVSPASWMIHSPRSVSTTSAPAASSAGVEVDLLGGHRLGLGDPGGAVAPHHVDDVAAGVLRGGRPAHVPAPGQDLVGEPLEQAGQVGQDLAA